VARARAVINLPVLDICEGRRLGRVKDLVVDPHLRRVKAVVVSSPGFLAPLRLVRIEHITGIGEDAVTLRGSDQLVKLQSCRELDALRKRVGHLRGRKVVTEMGSLVGRVDDFGFDEESGDITSFYLSGGLARDLIHGVAEIPASVIRVIGRDVLVATEEVSEYISRARSPDRYWTGLVQDLHAAWEATAGRAGDLADRMRQQFADRAAQLIDCLKAWQQRLQRWRANRGQDVGAEDLKAILGKRVGCAIVHQGEVLVKEGQEVTPEMVTRAREKGVLYQLFLAVALAEVREKIREAEGLLSEES